MSRKSARGRLARLGMVGATVIATIGITHGVAAPQASAVSSMSAVLSMGFRHDSLGRELVTPTVEVHVPMTQQDAAGYLYNGATLTIECWGDDTFFDDQLLYPRNETKFFPASNPYQSARGSVWAAPDGVRLTAGLHPARRGTIPSGPDADSRWGTSGYNEDIRDTDEIFCRVLWVDGDGARYSKFTNIRHGDF